LSLARTRQLLRRADTVTHTNPKTLRYGWLASLLIGESHRRLGVRAFCVASFEAAAEAAAAVAAVAVLHRGSMHKLEKAKDKKRAQAKRPRAVRRTSPLT
jgi:hypothetical protein